MVKLENIRKNNDVITCVAYLEDCRKPMELRYSSSTDDFDHFEFPEGYDWCEMHIRMIRSFFRTLKGSDYTQERMIMWY